jgi:hypothetical protein
VKHKGNTNGRITLSNKAKDLFEIPHPFNNAESAKIIIFKDA